MALRRPAARRCRPRTRPAGPGFTPLVPAPRLASALGVGEVSSSSTSSNPTHSFKDRVVAVAAAKATEFGLDTLVGDLDRQPRERGRRPRGRDRACSAVIFCPAGLEPEKLRATTVYGATIYAVRGSYDDCSRLVSELAGEVDWGIVNVNLRSYYAEGSKTLAFEIAEQLGWETPDAVVMPIGSGAMFTKVWQGFDQFRRLGLSTAPRRRLFGGQAEGCAPVASAFAEERRVSPVRPHVDRLVDRDRQPGRRRPRDRDRATTSGGAIYAVPEDEVGANIALLAETAGVFGEGATGVAVGALREAVARGELGADDRVVVLVTGTGLKTPQLADASRRGHRDRARRRRAARRAGGDRMTDGSSHEARDADRRRSTARCSRRSTGASSSCRSCTSTSGRAGLPLRDPGARGGDDRRRSRRENARPALATRASPSSSIYVLELTRRELAR